MKRIVYNKFDKSRISELPRATFNGRIIVVQTEAEAEKAVSYLLTKPLLGVDTETRPSFKRGITHQVALLQVSDEDTCFLFRLNMFGMSPAVIRLLEDQSVSKIGLSLTDDLMMLHKRADFSAGCFIDLQHFVSELGIKDMSLQKLYANVFGQRISKRERLSNWENQVLSDKQKVYAATDAWACLTLYQELTAMKESGDYELIVVPEPEPVKDEPITVQEENNLNP